VLHIYIIFSMSDSGTSTPDPPEPPPICKGRDCNQVATHQPGDNGVFRTCEQHSLPRSTSPLCMDPTCVNEAWYAWPGKVRTMCGLHFEDGMRNPYLKYCPTCERDPNIPFGEQRQATFGRDCRKPQFCAAHNKETRYANVMKGGDCRDGCARCGVRRGMVFDEARNMYLFT